MSDYQVFARKYRPLTFDDVLGQDHVIQTLRNAIEQDRLAHAYLFVGPRGTGKTSTARILAKALNCSGGPKVDFDPTEGICQEIAEGTSLDVLEIDGASNNGVDQVRELRETVSFAPASGAFKIYYIDEVHMLTTQAFNALLKTLEEPPAHVKFIFATTEPNKILPTILSRCQRFDLRRIPAGVIASHLAHIAKQESIELDEAAAYAIAKGADGGMRDAQSMLDQLVAFCGNRITEAEVLDIFGFNSQEAVAAFASVVLNQDTSAALETVHQQSESGKDLSKLLGDLIGHFRHLLVTKVSPGVEISDVSPEIAEMLKAQAESVGTERLLTVIDSLAETDGRMKWASNKRLHLEIGVIKAVQLLGETNLSDVVALLSDAAAAVPSGGAPSSGSPASGAAQSAPPPARAAAPTTAEASPTATPAPEQTADTTPAAASTSAEDAPPAGPTPGNLEGEALWQATVDYCRSERSLIDMWLRDAQFLSDADDEVSVGFPTSKAISRDSLDRHRGFIEEAMLVIAGRKKRLSLVVRNDIEPAPPVQIPEEVPEQAPPPAQPQADAPPPVTTPDTAATPPSPPSPGSPSDSPAPSSPDTPPFAPDNASASAPAEPAAKTGAASPPAESSADSPEAFDEEAFHNDELIQEALKEFEATIVKTESPAE